MERSTKVILGVTAIIVVLLVADLIWWNRLLSKGNVNYPKDIKWATNSKTLGMVESMHPKLRQRFADFFTEVEEKLGLYVISTSGLRTTAQQSGLDSKNEDNAEPGLSDHEYGFAQDINVADKTGKIILRKATPKKQWIDSGVVSIAKKHGFKWGGDFNSYYDPIHFYNDFGLPATKMLAMKKAGEVDKQGYLKV